MRALIGIWYSRERLAACSANQGINETIKIAIFSKLTVNAKKINNYTAL